MPLRDFFSALEIGGGAFSTTDLKKLTIEPNG